MQGKETELLFFFSFISFPPTEEDMYFELYQINKQIFFLIVCIYNPKFWLVTRCFSFATFQAYFFLLIYHPVKMSSRES